MRILFVSQRFPYPLDTGGNVRSFHLLKGLAAHHSVTLLCEEPVEGRVTGPLDALCEKVITVPGKARGLVPELLAYARSLATRSAFLLMRHYNPRLHAAVRRHRGAFDAIHFNHLDAALYHDASSSTAISVLDEHNIVTSQASTTLAAERGVLIRGLLRNELPRLRKMEGEIASSMGLVLTCSAEDEAHLRRLSPDANTLVVPNGVDLDHFRFRRNTRVDRQIMLFVGTMDYEPCDRAMRHFCANVLPLVRRQRPGVRLLIVGRNPSPALSEIAARDGGITLAGRVPDVQEVAATADVFVVPLLSGSGTRLKILEAMAMGIPVVTTSIGVEGIAAEGGVHCLIEDEAAGFASATVELLQDRERAGRLSEAARRLVEQRYGWPGIVNRLLDGYRTAAGHRPAASRARSTANPGASEAP